MPPTLSSHHAHTPARATPSYTSSPAPPTVSTSAGAAGLLARQLKQMQQAKDLPGISCGLVDDNVFEWEVMLMISDDCRYYGGGYCIFQVPLPLNNLCIRTFLHHMYRCTDFSSFERFSAPEYSLAPVKHMLMLFPRRKLLCPPHLPTHLPAPTTNHDLPSTRPFPSKRLPERTRVHQHPAPA
jgi:hypothetical protein